MDVDEPKLLSSKFTLTNLETSTVSLPISTHRELNDDAEMPAVQDSDSEIESFLQYVLKVPWNMYANRYPITQITLASDTANIDNKLAYLTRLEMLIDLMLTDTIRDHNRGLITTTANDGEIYVERNELLISGKTASSLTSPTVTSDLNASKETKEEDGIDMCPKPKLFSINSSNKGSILYFVNAYRLSYNFSKIIKDEILAILHSKIFDYCIITLANLMTPEDRSFVDLLHTNMISDAFCRSLIEISYRKKTFSRIFTSVLNHLYYDMRAACLDKVINTKTLIVLKQLTCITIVVDDVTIRPICDLMLGLDNFVPDLCTPSAGREVARVCYLSPFLSLSVFVEDNPKLAENYLASQNIFDKVMASSLQSVSNMIFLN